MGQQPTQQDDFNPRADTSYGYDVREEKVMPASEFGRNQRQKDDVSADDVDGFGRKRKQRDERQPLTTSEQYGYDDRTESTESTEWESRAAQKTHESPRRHSLEHTEPRPERRERRRRQSGDIEGMREREDVMGQR